MPAVAVGRQSARVGEEMAHRYQASSTRSSYYPLLLLYPYSFRDVGIPPLADLSSSRAYGDIILAYVLHGSVYLSDLQVLRRRGIGSEEKQELSMRFIVPFAGKYGHQVKARKNAWCERSVNSAGDHYVLPSECDVLSGVKYRVGRT